VKSSVEHLNPTRVKLTVEVPFDELKPHFDKAYGVLAGQVRIPGFRPGKVPARILDARLGRGTILSEVVNEAVPVKYGEAISEAQLTTLGQPDIEVTRIDDGDALAFTAEVDIRPEITLPDLNAVAVTVDDVEVTDADIDEQVEALRERFATTTGVDRAAADGDLVSIDLSAAVDGEVVDEATTEGLTYRIGEGDLIDGIDEAVTGLSAGESATFPTTLVAGTHAGQDAEVTVTVQSVSERELPAVDEDFAQLASEFDTVEELRADLAEKIRRVKNRTQAADARDKVLEALLEVTDVPTPEGVVDAEFKSREHDAVHAFDHDEDALNAHIEREGQTREEFDTELREGAVKSVKVQLLLDALAEASGVGVNQEEFTERVMFNAQRLGMQPDEYFTRLQEGNQLGAVFSEVRRGKALASAVEQATVTNASGEVLDVAALFGIETDLEEEQLLEQALEEAVEEEILEEVVDELLVEEAIEEAVEEAVEEAIEEEILEEALEEAVAEELVVEALEDAAEDELVEEILEERAAQATDGNDRRTEGS
jgi:trigger factor